MKRGGQLKRSWLRPKKSKRDWPKMTEETWANCGGRCEWCGDPIPYGNAPAHIIPRSAGKLSSDEAWNLAGMCIGGKRCHPKFDDNRARAVRQMEARGGCKLLGRIKRHPRLKAYFDILESKLKFIEDMKKGEDN